MKEIENTSKRSHFSFLISHFSFFRPLSLVTILLVIFIAFPLFSQDDTFDIEEIRRRIYGEDPMELMSFSLGDSNVSLFMFGSWKGSLQLNLGLSDSRMGIGFTAPETPLLFKQEVDLTLSLWINDKWFLEASFLDDYTGNTYSAGFEGFPEDFVKYAVIGNTGLNFPSFPYLDLGGDSISSFGHYGRMGKEDFELYTLLRFDAAAREERIFIGGRERTFNYIQPQNSIHGMYFVLPEKNIASDIIVFFEDERGNLPDGKGRLWRIAQPSEYAVSMINGLVELKAKPAGMVAAAYTGVGDNLGDYDTTGFLFEVQEWFTDRVVLKKYPQPGGIPETPALITIGSTPALVIYEPGTFSPFERRGLYEVLSGEAEQASLVRLSSGTSINGFVIEELLTNSGEDENSANPAARRKIIYELLRSDGNYDQRNPAFIWPLARDYPEIYLPGNNAFSGDIALRFSDFSSSGGYYIGTDIVPGSVQVWRNGIQHTAFSYSSSTGEVTISGPVGQNEMIRITFLKRSEETRLGSLAAGFGLNYQKKGSPFSVNSAIGARWNLTDACAFTEEGVYSTGSVGLTGQAALDLGSFKADFSAGFSLIKTDTTNLYRIAGMEGNETVLGLPSDASFVSNPAVISNPDIYDPPKILDFDKRAELIFRNYNSYNVFGPVLEDITWNPSPIPGINKPYPVKDRVMGNRQLLAAEFDLDADEWTGFQAPLGFYAEMLSRAVEIDIPFRLYGFNDTDNFRLLVQIGSLSGSENPFAENPDLIWEAELFPDDSNIVHKDTNTNSYLARFVLSDAERLKLGSANYLRIIAINESGAEKTGRVLLAPPVVRGTAFRAVTFDGFSVKSVHDFTGNNDVVVYETFETGAGALENSQYKQLIARLHPEGAQQRILKIDWKNMDSGVSAGFDGRAGEIPLSNYRQLSFFVNINDTVFSPDDTLRFLIGSGPESLSYPKLEVIIPLSEFAPQTWSKVTVRYQGNSKSVTVDGRNISVTPVYSPHQGYTGAPPGLSDYIAVLVNPASGSLPDGSISIDEIILEESQLDFRINAGTAAEYSRRGTILSIGSVSVLSDFSVSTALESEARIGDDSNPFSAGAVNRSAAAFSIFGVRVLGNLSFSASQGAFFWSADHSISRQIGYFSFAETFYTNDDLTRHTLNLSFNSPFYAGFNADAVYDNNRLRQRWNLNFGYRSNISFIPSVSVNAEALWNKFESLEKAGYTQKWAFSWVPLVPDTGAGAESRRTSLQISINLNAMPVGASLVFNGGTNFTKANSSSRADNSLFLDIPVVIGAFNINLRAGRNFSKVSAFHAEDLADDILVFSEGIRSTLKLWGFFPVYSLFTRRLFDTMGNLESSPQISFNDHFSVRLSFPGIYNLASFFVPRGASVRFDRVLEKKMDTLTDVLNISAGLNFSSINMFARLGYRPLFDFLRGDEYTHNLQGSFSINESNNISWRIQSNISANFSAYSGGSLSFSNVFSIRSGGIWSESVYMVFSYPAENTLLGVFYNWAASGLSSISAWESLASFLDGEPGQTRRETLEINFFKTGNYLNWSLSLSHEALIRIAGRMEFSGLAKLRLNRDSLRNIFSFDALFGITLRIDF